MKRFGISMVAALAMALTTAVTPAQESKPAEEPNYLYVQVRADNTQYKWGNSSRALLTGNVKITQGDTVMTADQIDYDQDENVQTAIATGNVKIVDPETVITGEKATAYFNKKLAMIEGNVKVLVKPKPQKPEDEKKNTVRSEFKDKATITCDKIEYLYKKKEANAAGNLKVEQKDRTITAGKLFYQVKQDKLTLSDGVKGRDSKNQTFSAPGTVVVSIKEGDEWLEMKDAVGTFRIKDEDEEEKPQIPANPAPGPAESEEIQQ